MTREQRQQSLANARRACEWLQDIAFSDEQLDELQCLIAEFTRLDEGEQKRNEAGRQSGHKGAEFGKLGAEHGHKGGRPRKPRTEET